MSMQLGCCRACGSTTGDHFSWCRESSELTVLLSVGDVIEFDHFGTPMKGPIVTVGKYGYWIRDLRGCVGHATIRCDFSKAALADR